MTLMFQGFYLFIIFIQQKVLGSDPEHFNFGSKLYLSHMVKMILWFSSYSSVYWGNNACMKELVSRLVRYCYKKQLNMDKLLACMWLTQIQFHHSIQSPNIARSNPICRDRSQPRALPDLPCTKKKIKETA